MHTDEAVVGARVRSLLDFYGVPKGTEGVIDQDYGSGVMVAWDHPCGTLPDGYAGYDGRPTIVSGILRDGFNKGSELQYLEVVVRDEDRLDPDPIDQYKRLRELGGQE